MNRTDLQQLAHDRASDAEALLAAGRWSAAYYFVGYAVECGLNACVAKQANLHDFPDKDRASKCYTHRAAALVVAAGLERDRLARFNASADFAGYWLIVKEWDEQSRYLQWTDAQARELFEAVTDPTDGVLPWITGHW